MAKCVLCLNTVWLREAIDWLGRGHRRTLCLTRRRDPAAHGPAQDMHRVATATLDLMTKGRIHFAFEVASSIMPHAIAGRVRLIGVSSAQPVALVAPRLRIENI